MTPWSFIRRSLLHYRRRHAAVVLGVAVAVAVLTGALVTGDSVRHSLKNISRVRLGKVQYALASGDRYLRAALADEIGEALDIPCTAALRLEGTARSGDGSRRIPRVQVLGVDPEFWAFGLEPLEGGGPEAGEVVVDLRVARELGVKAGDSLLLRVRKPQAMPAEVSFSTVSKGTWTERLQVRAVASDEQMGRFSLRVSQLPESTVFLSRLWLSRMLVLDTTRDEPGDPELFSRANILLVGSKSGMEIESGTLDAELAKHWTMIDAGFRVFHSFSPSLREGKPLVEIRSDRVFLSLAEEKAALSAGGNPIVILTYFVNSIRAGDKSTPYSFVSAPGPPLIPDGMDDDEILVNEWLAEDLGAKPGDRIELTYFVLGPLRKLEEASSTFTVRAVVPLRGPAADPSLMPDFPGLAGVNNCTDWDPAIPVDLDRIRDKDEKYWDDHRGTPKAFVTLKTAQKLWANDWGRLTAVRYQADDAPTQEEILKKLPPESFGLRFRDVRAEAERAGSSGVDFGQLFLGLSFFLIVSALLLTGLLFALGVQDRASETGLLLALGFTPRKVAGLHLREGLLLVLLGSLIGVGGGVLYNLGVLAALGTLWRGAVGTQAITAHVRPASLLIGAACGVVCGLGVLWIVLWRTTRRTVRALQADDEPSMRKRRTWSRIAVLASALSLFAALAVAFTQDPGRGRAAAGAFAGAGSLLLLSGLALCGAVLLRLASRAGSATLRLWSLGLRRASRRPLRSLATIAVLACGVFLVVSIGANRHDLSRETDERSSGTGGFAFFGETALPLFHDLKSVEGRKAVGLDDADLGDAHIVTLRLRDGDDASCLNLNRVPQPRVLGVDPGEFAERRAFTFTRTLPGIDPDKAWEALDKPLEDGAVPGVADETVIVWGLGKSVGDTIATTDEEGREFKVRLIGALANSVFQGHVLISEKAFRERFPSVQGARVFLVDMPAGGREKGREHLLKALEDRGVVLQSSAERLASFQTVENTYLDIFMILGGLGLILGSAGLGVVVVRNVLERRGELALLRAVGFTRPTLHRLVLWEHAFLFLAGFGVGMVAAVGAVIPALSSPGASIPFATLGVLLAILLVSGLAWTSGAAWVALRGDLMPALREE